ASLLHPNAAAALGAPGLAALLVAYILPVLVIHLTQVTPTCSVRARGGLSTHAGGVRSALRHGGCLSSVSRPAALAGRLSVSEVRRHDGVASSRRPLAVRRLWSTTSVTAGTVFQDTRTPLTAWFRAMWWVTNSKAGTSALTLQRL